MTSVLIALAREAFAEECGGVSVDWRQDSPGMPGTGASSERPRGNGIQSTGIPASRLTVAAVASPDGIVLGR